MSSEVDKCFDDHQLVSYGLSENFINNNSLTSYHTLFFRLNLNGRQMTANGRLLFGRAMWSLMSFQCSFKYGINREPDDYSLCDASFVMIWDFLTCVKMKYHGRPSVK